MRRHLAPGGRLAFLTSNKYLRAEAGAKAKLLASGLWEETLTLDHRYVTEDAAKRPYRLWRHHLRADARDMLIHAYAGEVLQGITDIQQVRAVCIK